jgi:phosphoglycolate phosphatase
LYSCLCLFVLMKNIRLVIFDLDGTLIDAYKAIYSSLNFTMARLGYPCQRISVIRRAVGWGDKNLLRPFVDKKDLASALKVYRKHHEKSLQRYSRVFPQVKKLLSSLGSKGYELAVASNRPTKFSAILIRHLGLNKYFDFVLCADKLKKGKPHPEILKKIMKKFSVLPQQTLYVGDMVIDAQAGKRAAVRTVIVTTGSSGLAEIRKEKPYAIIRKVADLRPLL